MGARMTKGREEGLGWLRRCEELRDRITGRRDGRKRQPTFNAATAMSDRGVVVTTPYSRALMEKSFKRIEDAYEAFVTRTAGRYGRLATLRSRRASALAEHARLVDAVRQASAPLTAEELLPRNPFELAAGDLGQIRGRREALRALRISSAQADEAAGLNSVRALDVELVSVASEITNEFVVAQAQSKQIGSRFAQRVEAYWENLVLVHPEGPYLLPLLISAVRKLPSWVAMPPSENPDAYLSRPLEPQETVHRLSGAQGEGTPDEAE
jgi:hypothetical protein